METAGRYAPHDIKRAITEERESTMAKFRTGMIMTHSRSRYKICRAMQGLGNIKGREGQVRVEYEVCQSKIRKIFSCFVTWIYQSPFHQIKLKTNWFATTLSSPFLPLLNVSVFDATWLLDEYYGIAWNYSVKEKDLERPVCALHNNGDDDYYANPD